jgi:hypothetical protein
MGSSAISFLKGFHPLSSAHNLAPTRSIPPSVNAFSICPIRCALPAPASKRRQPAVRPSPGRRWLQRRQDREPQLRIARRVLHSALTLVQKSRRLPGRLDRGRTGRCVINSDEETKDGRPTLGPSFGVCRAAKRWTAFSTAFSLVSNGPVYAAVRFRLVDASVQYHPSDPFLTLPKNTPISDGTLPILPPSRTLRRDLSLNMLSGVDADAGASGDLRPLHSRRLSRASAPPNLGVALPKNFGQCGVAVDRAISENRDRGKAGTLAGHVHYATVVDPEAGLLELPP